MGLFTATVCCLVVMGCLSAPSKSGPQDGDFTRALDQLRSGTYDPADQDKQGLDHWEYNSRSAEFAKALLEMQKRRADERKLSLGKTIQSVPSNVQMKAAIPVTHSSYSFLDIMGVIMCCGIGLAVILFCGCLVWKCKADGPTRPLAPL